MQDFHIKKIKAIMESQKAKQNIKFMPHSARNMQQTRQVARSPSTKYVPMRNIPKQIAHHQSAQFGARKQIDHTLMSTIINSFKQKKAVLPYFGTLICKRMSEPKLSYYKAFI